MFVALFARPWILGVCRLGAQARVLADDTRVFARGAGAVHRAVGAFQATVDFVGDVGGAFAPSKSLLF
eukprot:11179634-Lingulodinium_polyedra.AAC.1